MEVRLPACRGLRMIDGQDARRPRQGLSRIGIGCLSSKGARYFTPDLGVNQQIDFFRTTNRIIEIAWQKLTRAPRRGAPWNLMSVLEDFLDQRDAREIFDVEVSVPVRQDFPTARWIAASKAGASIGLTKCSRKPAALLWATSASEPKPLIAMPHSLCLAPNSFSNSQPVASGRAMSLTSRSKVFPLERVRASCAFPAASTQYPRRLSNRARTSRVSSWSSTKSNRRPSRRTGAAALVEPPRNSP